MLISLETYRVPLVPPCLTLSIIRYVSRVKWSNPGKGEVLSPTPWCISYWKGSFQVAFDYSRQLYFYLIPYDCKLFVLRILTWFTNGPGDQGSIPGQVILKKWYLMLPCFALSTIRWGSRVKWSNLGNRLAPSPTSWCSSYWKGSLKVANFTYLTYLYSYMVSNK